MKIRLVDFSPQFNADKMKSRILMWHGLQDPISPILHLDLMKEALEENNVDYQSFTMTRLGHTFGREEDMRATSQSSKIFYLSELTKITSKFSFITFVKLTSEIIENWTQNQEHYIEANKSNCVWNFNF